MCPLTHSASSLLASSHGLTSLPFPSWYLIALLLRVSLLSPQSFAELQSRASARRHAPSGDLDAHPGMRMGQSFLELLAQAGIHPKEVNWGDLLGPVSRNVLLAIGWDG